jgi:hypothetical protein
MRLQMLLRLSLIAVCLTVCGCGPKKPETVGFLTSYAHLRPETTLRSVYFPHNNRLAEYGRFIVEPVALYLDDETTAQVSRDTTPEELAQYLHDTMVKTLEPRYPATGVTPGPGTARLRMALTHLKRGGPLSVGGAAIEAELLDSQTGEQLLAIREIQEVKTTPSLDNWNDSKLVMDDWARRFYAALEENR